MPAKDAEKDCKYVRRPKEKAQSREEEYTQLAWMPYKRRQKAGILRWG